MVNLESSIHPLQDFCPAAIKLVAANHRAGLHDLARVPKRNLGQCGP